MNERWKVKLICLLFIFFFYYAVYDEPDAEDNRCCKEKLNASNCRCNKDLVKRQSVYFPFKCERLNKKQIQYGWVSDVISRRKAFGYLYFVSPLPFPSQPILGFQYSIAFIPSCDLCDGCVWFWCNSRNLLSSQYFKVWNCNKNRYSH